MKQDAGLFYNPSRNSLSETFHRLICGILPLHGSCRLASNYVLLLLSILCLFFHAIGLLPDQIFFQCFLFYPCLLRSYNIHLQYPCQNFLFCKCNLFLVPIPSFPCNLYEYYLLHFRLKNISMMSKHNIPIYLNDRAQR